MSNLKEKLKEDLAKDGKVSISSADIGEFKAKEEKANPARDGEDVSIKVADSAKKDPILAGGAAGDPGLAIASTSNATAPASAAAGGTAEGGFSAG